MFTYRDVLDSDGLIAQRRPGYERRAAQLAMAAEVDAAIRNKKCLAVEAGTGVGKSFAYLVPAILYVVGDKALQHPVDDYFVLPDDEEPTSSEPIPEESENEKTEGEEEDDALRCDSEEMGEEFLTGDMRRRVVISTHTISLQEQLFKKDIPFLNSLLPFEFTSTLVKGRSNYLCRRRFESAARAASGNTLFETDQQTEMRRLRRWLEETYDGSRSELDPPVPNDVWNEINCERGNCTGKKCPFRDSCFFVRARNRVKSANLIIVNHALLFSDLALTEGAILPDYDVLIFDEAHTMEEVAAEHLGVEVTEYAVEYLLTRLYNSRLNKGLLAEELASTQFLAEHDAFVDAADRVDDCVLRTEEFFNELRAWLEARPNSNGRVLEPNIVSNGLGEGLRALKRVLGCAADLIEEPGRRQEYIAATQRVTDFIAALDDWLEQRAEGYAYWLESAPSRGKNRITLKAAPIDVAPILRTRLFNVVPTVVATSATLTTGRKFFRGAAAESTTIEEKALAINGVDESEETRRAFAFFRHRVGMTGAAARSLGSPYNYREQMTLVLVRGLERSEPSLDPAVQQERNEERLWRATLDYIDETDGGAFVLFTNAQQMRRATTALASAFAERNYPFFSQAEGGSRQLMVERFKESSRSVLFGVDSFWQGVDVPGAALRNVVIVKFPFLSPSHPLVEARIKSIDENGGSSFRDYLLPTAILKFKQGVGRLIRTREDKGIVVLLDERAHTKGYGRDFLASLQDCKVRLDSYR